jgi:hypothetical protein
MGLNRIRLSAEAFHTGACRQTRRVTAQHANVNGSLHAADDTLDVQTASQDTGAWVARVTPSYHNGFPRAVGCPAAGAGTLAYAETAAQNY